MTEEAQPEDLEGATLDRLVRMFGFSRIPWKHLRRCECPHCAARKLHYADSLRANGDKNYNQICCHGCSKRYKAREEVKF